MKFFQFAAIIATVSALRLRATEDWDAVQDEIEGLVEEHYKNNEYLTIDQVLEGAKKVGEKHCANGNIPKKYCTPEMAKHAEKHIRKEFAEAAGADGKLTAEELMAHIEKHED